MTVVLSEIPINKWFFATIITSPPSKVVWASLASYSGNKKSVSLSAVEHFFGVTVTQVRTMNVRGKVKRMGRFQGKRADWKKAVVTLAKDDSIDLFEIV